MENIKGKLSIVGTPIGNLEDITFRAIRTLKEADIILCEDTRTASKLLNHYSISKKTISYHVHSKLSKTDSIIDSLKNGAKLAMISDAGTPSISDPGSKLIENIRNICALEIQNGEIKIEAIPGPSALITALSIAGINCAEFTFLGFMPHKKGREKIFNEIANSDRTYVFYESVHRIEKTLEFMKKEIFNNKQIVICRELTKIFEETVSGNATQVFDYFVFNPDKIKGEFVVIVGKATRFPSVA